nr:MAG: polyprotein [Nepovirus sp. 'monocotyledonae']
MATFQIGSVTLQPRCVVEERKILGKWLKKNAISSFAALLMLDAHCHVRPYAVARAVCNGFLLPCADRVGFSAPSGAHLTLEQCACIVRRVTREHTAGLAITLSKFRKECIKRCNAFEEKKAARKAAGVKRACKLILASLDAPVPVAPRVLRKIRQDSRAAWRISMRKSDLFRAIRADKRAERAYAREFAAPVVRPCPPVRAPYVCPLNGNAGQWATDGLRSTARSVERTEVRSVRTCEGPVDRPILYMGHHVVSGVDILRRVSGMCLHPTTRALFSSDYAGTVSITARVRLAHALVDHYACVGLMSYVSLFQVDPDFDDIKASHICDKLYTEIRIVRETLTEGTAHGMFMWVGGIAAATVAGAASVSNIYLSTVRSTVDYVADKYRECASSTAEHVRQATTAFGEAIFEVVRKQFFDCLSPYLKAFAYARAEIEKYWQLAKAWATKMWSNLTIEVQSFFDSTWYALALLVVAGIVLFAEQLLCRLGIIAGAATGSLLSMFLTLFLAYCGWSLGTGDPALGTILGSIRAFIFALFCDNTPEAADVGTANNAATCNGLGALDFPLHLMNVVGTGLISAPLGTLQYIGRYGQALDQIRKGKDAMKEFIGFCFDRFADAWDHISGRRDTFFREMAAMTKVDILQWIRQSQTVLLEAQTTAITDPILLETTTHLLYKGTVLQVTLAGARRATSLNYGRVVSTLIAELMKIRAQCARAGKFEGRRCEPFWVYMYGPSHCGKSLFMEEVSRRLLREYGHAPNDIYAKNARDDYWSGYLQQACVQVDDLSACVTKPSLESEFLQLVGSKMYPLNMAAVEDKGMLFNSTLIVTTSNVFGAPTPAEILDNTAYKNRRGVVVQCRAAPDVAFDPSNPNASCEARLVDRVDETPLGAWRNCTAVLEEIVNASLLHRNKEIALMASYRTRCDTLHPIHLAAKNFLHTAAQMDLLRTVVCDDTLYEIDPITLEAAPSTDKPNHGFEDVCIQRVNTINQHVEFGACSGMLTTFVNSLVEGPCHVDSVHSLNTGANNAHREFFSALSLAERIHLRLMQKRLDMMRASPDFGFGIDIKSRIMHGMAEGYKAVTKHGGKALCLLGALLLIYLCYHTFFSQYRVFVKGDKSAVAAVGLMASLTANAGCVSSSYSSAGSVQSYHSRNPPIYYRNRTTATANASNSDEYCSDALMWLTLPDGTVVSGIRFRHGTFLITQHQAEAIADGTHCVCNYITARGVVSHIHFVWDSANLVRFGDTEAVMYREASLTMMPRAPPRYFDLDHGELARTIEVNGCVIKRYSNSIGLPSDYDGLQPTDVIMHRWTSVGTLNTQMQAINTVAYGGSYRNELPTSFKSNCPTNNWDCGAIISGIVKGQRRIIAMHVASGPSQNNAQTVSTATFLPPFLEEATCNGVNYIAEEGVSTPGYKKEGWISSMKDRPYYSAATMFVPVPSEMRYIPPILIEKFEDGTEREVVVEVKQPAILSKDDPRIPEGIQYDPLVHGMQKFAEPMDLLDDALCSEIFTDISDSWYECFNNLEDLTDEVAINGCEEEFFDAFNMHTSEGYPWVKHRMPGQSGKSRYFESVDDSSKLALRRDTEVYTAYENLQQQCYTSVPQLICIETPKDECLPLRKISIKPKTRLFSILPLEYNLLLRKKFLAFAASLQRNRGILPTQVGINPYSREWQHIYERLQKQNSVAINCDYASFDGLITSQILKHICIAINRVYGDSKESKLQRTNLLMGIVGRLSICGSQVYRVVAGIPSGCALTVLLNSIYNEFLMRMVWKTCVGGVPRERFSHYVTLLIYGDDNLVSVHPDYLAQYNGEIIREKLAKLHVTITDGSDKTSSTIKEKPLYKLDFLKRRFKKNLDGTVYAPLDLASIYTSLQNVTMGAGSVALAVQQNAHVALIELYLHDNACWYNDLRSFYVNKFGWRQLPTFLEARAFHREQITGVTPWVPHRVFDVPIEKELLKREMASHGKGDFVVCVCPQLFVVGSRWKSSNCSKQFIVSTTPLNCGEVGLCVEPVYNEGVGRMPSERWVRAFRSIGAYPTVKAAYHSGRDICFRSEAPYTLGWCAAIAFAQGLQLDYKAILQLYYNVCLPSAPSITHYFDRPRFGLVSKVVVVDEGARTWRKPG